jgi:recombination associated protein RdgC
MWFKNLQIYRLPAPWAFTQQQLEAALAPHAFVPCSSLDLLRQGWTAPRDSGQLVHVVNGQFLLQLRTEKKLLPSSVINQAAKARADMIEEEQGFGLGKKAMKELKERIADDLLPSAFSVLSAVHVWIDPVNGWLAIDSSSPGKADDVIKLLLKAIDKLPLESLRVQRSPVAVMTEWLQTDEAPHSFTIDQDAEMRATGEGRATVRYVRHTLEADDLGRHIAAGKQCTRLALTWNSKVSFVLTETLAIKSIKALDIMTESSDRTGNDAERFDSDLTLMTGEMAQLLADLVEALGGEATV